MLLDSHDLSLTDKILTNVTMSIQQGNDVAVPATSQGLKIWCIKATGNKREANNSKMNSLGMLHKSRMLDIRVGII